LLGEQGVANGQRLVNNQNVGVHMCNDRECQAHVHPGRIRLYMLVNEFADLRKCKYVVQPFINLLLGQSQYGGIQIDVFSAGELRVKTSAQLQQGSDTAVDLDFTRGGRERAADEL